MNLKNPVQKSVLTGVMAAVLAVLSQIAIPMPTGVPVTLQTFAVALCGYILGAGLGTLSVGVYLALGAVGLPIFTEFSGGFGVFLGVTGGFLWGFLPMAFLCGLGVKRGGKVLAILLGVSGLLVCHLCGVAQFMVVMSTSFRQAFLIASAPFLVKDIISVALAFLAAAAITSSLKKARIGGAA